MGAELGHERGGADRLDGTFQSGTQRCERHVRERAFHQGLQKLDSLVIREDSRDLRDHLSKQRYHLFGIVGRGHLREYFESSDLAFEGHRFF